MESAATIGTTQRDGGLVWEVAGKPVSVRLSLDVVGRLGMAVQEGFKALRRRGLETGGLLIGTRKKAGNRVIVDIDDFEAIESEHAAGPSYILSETDRHLLEARVTAHRAARTGRYVVGLYRSHTRSGFAMTMEDGYLFSTNCREASDVYLLIKSNDGGPPTAGFIIREGGKVLADTPYAQFPFSQNFAMLPHADEARVEALPVSPLPVAVAEVAVAELIPARRRLNWMTTRSLMAAIVVLAFGLAFGIGMRVAHPTITEGRRPLALNVVNTGNTLRLSWDREASRRADQAVLWIQDGRAEERVELDARQLREGSIAYWPRSNDVNFRFQLLMPGAAVSESIRAIGGPFQQRSDALVAAEAAAAVSPAIGVPSTKPRQRMRRARASTAIELPQLASRPATLAERHLPDAPPIQPTVSPPLGNLETVLKSIVPASGPAVREDAAFRVSVESVSGSRLERLAGHIPLVGKRYRRSDYVPPVPRPDAIAHPPLPNAARPINIDVKLYVDPSGNVQYSELRSKVPATDRDFAAAVVFSSRQWKFVPARLGDDSVDGEVILHYRFGGTARAAGNLASGTH